MSKTYSSKEVCSILNIDYSVLRYTKFRYKNRFSVNHVVYLDYAKGLEWLDEGINLLKELIGTQKEFNPPDSTLWVENLMLQNILGISYSRLTYSFRMLQNKNKILLDIDYTHYQYKGVTRLYWSESGIKILKDFLNKKQIERSKPKKAEEFKPIKEASKPKKAEEFKPIKEAKVKLKEIPQVKSTKIKVFQSNWKNKKQTIANQRAEATQKYLDKGYTKERAILKAMNDYPDIDLRDTLS